METDFTGIGTSVMYARLLAHLFVGAYRAAEYAARKAAAVCRERAAPRPSVASGNRVSDALRAAVQSGRLKPSTAGKYRNVMAHFIAALGREELTAVTPDLVEEFLDARAALGVGRGGRRVDLGALRTVLDRLLGQDSTVGLHYAPRSEPVEAATQEQVTTLLGAAEDDRDRALVLMLNVLKLRPGQIVEVRAEDIHLAERALVLPHDQPGTCTLVGIPEELAAPLERILHEDGDRQWLFSSARQPARPVTVRALQKRLSRIAARCGRHLTCTALRKAESILCAAGDCSTDPKPVRSEAPAPDAEAPLTPARVVMSVTVLPQGTLRGPPRRDGAGAADEAEAAATPARHERPALPLRSNPRCYPAA
jgi:integrase